MDESQRRIEIDFERSDETEKWLQEYGIEAQIPLSFTVGKDQLTDSVGEDNWDFEAFANVFWTVCLSGLPDLKAGKTVTFELEGRELVFEPADSSVDVYLDYHSKEAQRRLTVPFQALASELIVSAEEFVEYCRTIRAPIEDVSLRFLESEVADARAWYNRTYDESV